MQGRIKLCKIQFQIIISGNSHGGQYSFSVVCWKNQLRGPNVCFDRYLDSQQEYSVGRGQGPFGN